MKLTMPSADEMERIFLLDAPTAIDPQLTCMTGGHSGHAFIGAEPQPAKPSRPAPRSIKEIQE